MWLFTERQREKFIMNDMKINKKLNGKQRDHIINTILQKKLFNYKMKDLLHYFVSCSFCRSRKSLRENSVLRKHNTFMNGQAKLNREFDILKVL